MTSTQSIIRHAPTLDVTFTQSTIRHALRSCPCERVSADDGLSAVEACGNALASLTPTVDALPSVDVGCPITPQERKRGSLGSLEVFHSCQDFSCIGKKTENINARMRHLSFEVEVGVDL